MERVYKGRVFSVEVGRVALPERPRASTSAIVRHPPSVVLIPVPDDGRVILIRQYRADASIASCGNCRPAAR